MNLRRLLSLLFAGAIAALPSMRAAKAAADILSPDQRRTVVEKAEQLAHPAALPPLPNPLPSPFGSLEFDRPEASEGRDAGPANKAAEAANTAPALPATDREVLAAVAAKIPTTGTIILGGKPLLISGTNRIETGSRFTVVYSGQEYELELVAITNTSFTVRYKGEEYTRPIHLQVPTKQGK